MSRAARRSIPAVLGIHVPVLGICYGHQLIAHHLGGKVEKGDRGEYGLAHLKVMEQDRALEWRLAIADLDEPS